MQNRRASEDELRLIEFLINAASIKMPEDWKERLTVKPMNDGGMGSLILCLNPNCDGNRIFGKQISDCHFIDNDGVDAIASLNVDQKGDLFELDIWKVDYSPTIKIPDKFDFDTLK